MDALFQTILYYGFAAIVVCFFGAIIYFGYQALMGFFK